MTTVIYDGECDFCKSCIAWVAKRVQINAVPNQTVNEEIYGVSRAQLEKSVCVMTDRTYFGAAAVSVILNIAGHPILSKLLKASGPVGEWGYKYVAAHRDGLIVKFLHWLIKRS